MNFKYFITCYIFFIFFSTTLFSQENVKILKKEFKTSEKGCKKAMKSIKYGDYYYKKNSEGSFQKAIKFYSDANKYNSANAELNYKTGICYLYSIYKDKSLEYLEKAYTLNNTVADDIFFSLASAYQYNYQPVKAIEYFEKYITSTTDENKKSISEKKIEECKNGIELMKDTAILYIENISLLNSAYKDYSPLINGDGTKMIFTSRRENTTGGMKDPDDEQFYEDIYISSKIKNTGWTLPENIGNAFNSDNHDASVGISFDGQQLITFKNGDLYISHLKGEKWTSPEALPKTINTSEIESSACFSPDGNRLYFVRGKNFDVSKSNGDIYFCTKISENKWSEATTLSPTINTEFDEDAVFMNPDGKTLYFSSKGHNTMGGFDIFKTELLENGNWSEPQNLGFPINSPFDDIYFVTAGSGKTCYYSAVKNDGLGYNDIYKIVFPNGSDKLILTNEDNLIACISEPEKEISFEDKVQITILKGIVLDSETGLPVEAEIEIYDNSTNELIFSTKSNSSTGEFLFTLSEGKNYGISISKDGYLFYSENIDLQDKEFFQKIETAVQMVNIEENAKIILKNIFFDTGQTELKPESISELQRIVNLMNENPTLKVEISGHTDNFGSYELNLDLSQIRAYAVVEYLVKNGINENRITANGYAYDQPVADNSTKEGRAINRRVEFKIISK